MSNGKPPVKGQAQEGGAYSATLNLPKTDFPMKGDLPVREPELLSFWGKLGLYERLQLKNAGRPAFVLHDGPPYANGHIHIGHALNKILKDMSLKTRALMGFRTPYVPGWDCHGLPIETALLKEMKMSKRGITDIPLFRKEAEAFAERFIGLQRDEFRRLGGIGDWDRPYRSMSKEYVSKVLRAFRLLVKQGFIYRGLKPVFWCVTCESALAEAEIEYKDKTSPSIYVAFQITKAGVKELEGAEILVWTTTPWTMPANRAAAFHPDLDYVLAKLGGRRLLLARARLEAVAKALGGEAAIAKSWKGSEIASALRYERPYGGEGVGVLADYVTAEDGTGVVHTAPGHGADDFATGQKYGLEIANPVDNSGVFTALAGPMAGKHIFKAGNAAVIEDLTARGRLLKAFSIQHSYPHCWRCKNPVVFRTTEQWFLSVAQGGLREALLGAIGKVSWVPPEGQARISAMVSGRPDWCLSRQRVWGTPIPVLFCAKCHKPVLDDAVLETIERQTGAVGDGFWFERWGESVGPKSWPFLPQGLSCCGQSEFRREQDILDVWMDSGASWLSVLDGRIPCDLYLEGSDQHRGWFQSSLVLATALEGRAPYKAVLTHGFVLDEKGHAMHKSAGNVVAPQEVIAKVGADVLRLWAALSDYSDDVRISDKLLEGPADSYRKLRNTMRYLLGNTYDFETQKDAVPHERLPELERFLLHRLAELQESVLADYAAYRYRAAARKLVDFCSFDLSAFYLDVLKDRLYTYRASHPARRAGQTAMTFCLERLLLLVSPILSFTAEEAWRYGPAARGGAESVFLADLPPVEKRWLDPALAAKWTRVLEARVVAQKALEEARAAKRIGKSLEAAVTLSGEVPAGVDWPEILVVSSVELAGGAGAPRAEVSAAAGEKCARCWRRQADVGSANPADVCGRCAQQLSAA